MDASHVATTADTDSLPKEYFQQVPNVLVNHLKEKKLKPIDLAVYMVYVKHRGENDFGWPSNGKVARIIGREKRAVIDSNQRLQRWGYLSREKYNPTTGTKQTVLLTYVDGGRVIGPALENIPTPACHKPATRKPTPSPTQAAQLSQQEIREILGGTEPAKEKDADSVPCLMDEF